MALIHKTVDMTKAEGFAADNSNNGYLQMASSLPLTVILWLPIATVPTGFKECNGQAIPISSYQDFANTFYCGDANNGTALYGYKCTNQSSPTNSRNTTGSYIVLPDLRGEFIRGWDHGRMIDYLNGVSRGLGTWQADMIISHNHQIPIGGVDDKNFAHNTGQPPTADADGINYTGVYTANTGGIETRPRNIDLMPIIKVTGFLDTTAVFYTKSQVDSLLSSKADLIGGKVPASQLPAYVDDVLEYTSLSAFPTTGETGKIYVALDTNLTYRWSGTQYIEISKSLALGETPSTAYPGDKGKMAYDHSQASGNPHGATTANISDSTDKRYVTDTEKAVLDNTSGINTGDQDLSGFIYRGLLNDSYFDGLFSDTLSIQAMSQRTGTGTRADGTVYTNPLTFKDVSGIRVKQILGQTLKNIPSNSSFTNGITGWGLNKIVSPTVANNEITFTALGQYAQVQGSVGSLIVGHVYYVSGMMKAASNGATLRINASGTIMGGRYHSGSGNYERLSKVFTATVSTPAQFLWQDDTASNWTPISCKEGILIDLTASFGIGKEPAQSWCDANIVWFDGTVSIINSTVRSQNSDGSKYTDLTITGSLRSLLDNGTLYQDRLYNANGKWYIDRWVDPTTGNKLATMTTEVAMVSGNLVAYKGGSIQILNSAIAPKCDLQYMESDGEYETYIPTLTWTGATPSGVTVIVKYSKKGKKIILQLDFNATNGLGASNLTISLPFAAKSGGGKPPVMVQEIVNGALVTCAAYLDDSTSLIKFRSFGAMTSGQAAELHLTVSYEMA